MGHIRVTVATRGPVNGRDPLRSSGRDGAQSAEVTRICPMPAFQRKKRALVGTVEFLEFLEAV